MTAMLLGPNVSLAHEGKRVDGEHRREDWVSAEADGIRGVLLSEVLATGMTLLQEGADGTG